MSIVLCPHCQTITTLPRAPAERPTIPAVCARCGTTLADTLPMHEAIQAPDMQIDSAARPYIASQDAINTSISPARPAPADTPDLLDRTPPLQREMQRLMHALPDMTLHGPPDSLPGDLPDLVDDLGPPVASLRIPGIKTPDGQVIGAVILIVVGLATLATFVPAYALSGHMDMAELTGVFGALLLGLGVWMYHIDLTAKNAKGFDLLEPGDWIVPLRRVVLPMRLWVCPEGVIWEQAKRVEYCRWDQIESVNAPLADSEQVLWFTPRQGIDIKLSTRLGPVAVAIAAYIDMQTAVARLPIDLARVRKGVRVCFGELSVDSAGIVYRHRLFPWSELSEMSTHGNQLIIHDTRSRPHITVALRLVSFPRVAEAIARIMIDKLPA